MYSVLLKIKIRVPLSLKVNLWPQTCNSPTHFNESNRHSSLAPQPTPIWCNCRPGSSVGIATDYGLDGPGWNPGGDGFFPPVQTGPGAHPVSCTMGTESFSGVKCGRGVLLTTHTLLLPRSWKSRAIPVPTFWATPGV